MKLKNNWFKTIDDIYANPQRFDSLKTIIPDLEPCHLSHNRKTFGRSIPLTLQNLFFEVEESDFDHLSSLTRECAKGRKDKILELIWELKSENSSFVDKGEETLCPVSLVKFICRENQYEYQRGILKIQNCEKSLLAKYEVFHYGFLDSVGDFLRSYRSYQENRVRLKTIDRSFVQEYLDLVDEGQRDLRELGGMFRYEIANPRDYVISSPV